MIADSTDVLVFEKDVAWTMAISQSSGGVSTRRAASLAECREALASRPRFVALELRPDNVEGVLQLLFDLPGLSGSTQAVVLARGPMAAYGPLARELGASEVLTSPAGVDRLAEMVRHEHRGLAELKLTFEERVWASLPWGKAAPANDGEN